MGEIVVSDNGNVYLVIKNGEVICGYEDLEDARSKFRKEKADTIQSCMLWKKGEEVKWYQAQR